MCSWGLPSGGDGVAWAASWALPRSCSASASCPGLSYPCCEAGALSQLSLQRCLEEECTGAHQASEATLEPTLAGEEPEQAPEYSASSPRPT